MKDATQRKAGAILSYVSIVVSTLVQLLYTPFLIRTLGQSEYGLYSIVSSIIGYLTVLDLGFGNAIIVYSTKYHEKGEFNKEEKLHGMFFVIYLMIGLIATILGLILFFLVPTIFGNSMNIVEISKMKIMMLILTFNLAITFPFTVYQSIITAREKFVFQKSMNIVSTLLKPLLMIPLLFMGYKSITMAVVITIVNLIIMLSNYVFCRKKLNVKIRYNGMDKILFKEIFAYSFWIFLNQIVDCVNWNVDQFVLGAICGTIVTSVYAVASQINHLFINLSTAMSGVLLPKMSKMVAKNVSDRELSDEFIKVGRIQYYIIFLIASGLVLFGKEFFISWAGQEYVDAYYISLILIIPLSIPLIQNLGISILQAKNMHKFRSILYVIIAIANIGISIPLSIMFGGIGAAIGTALSLIVGNIIIINIYYYRKVHLDIPRFWLNILNMTIPFLIPIVIILLIKHFIIIKGLTSVLVYGGIYTVIYGLVSYFIDMNKYEKSVIKKILAKFKLGGV